MILSANMMKKELFFSVKQYRCVVKNGFKHYDTVVNETNLTKQEAWELFKSLTIKAVKEAFSNNKLTYYCDNYDYLCLPTVYTNISTIYGDKTVRFPDSPEWSIASNVYFIKNDHPEYNWEEYCNNLLRKAKNSFFAGKYEYTSY